MPYEGHPSPTTGRMELSDVVQDIIARYIKTRRGVFLTGAAGKFVLTRYSSSIRANFHTTGTGKTTLLQALTTTLRQEYWDSPDSVAITAATGVAAALLGGTTLHSWAGLPATCLNTDAAVAKVRVRKGVSERWKRAKILIIDEGKHPIHASTPSQLNTATASMISGRMFQQLSDVAGAIRCKPYLPFGGITLVVVADFFQLPPVQKSASPYFAFQSVAWGRIFQPQNSVVLASVHRQKSSGTSPGYIMPAPGTDQRRVLDLIGMLNNVRTGVVTGPPLKLLHWLSRPLTPSMIQPVELYARRDDVDLANSSRLSLLPSPSYSFLANDYASNGQPRVEFLLRDMVAPARLDLRVGSQVMLIRNVDVKCGLVNGTTGKVVGFHRASEVSSSIEGGVSDHAIRSVIIDNQGRPVPPKHPQPPRSHNDDLYPLVSIPAHSGHPPETLLLMKHEFQANDAQGRTLVRRRQVPLILAWALTIHRSQGATIPRVAVNLGKVYTHGQAYVALSRCPALEGIQILGFQPSQILAHPDVLAFYKQLGSLEHPVYTILQEDP